MVTKITYREKGQGKILICLHGYGGNVLHWEKVTDDLVQQFKVITPNLSHLFMGREMLSFSQQIEQIASFIQAHFPRERIFLAGISYGAALSWGIASQYPELVEKVVFVNPMPPFATRYFAIPSLRMFFSIPLSKTLIYLFLSSPFGKYFLTQFSQVFRSLQATENIERAEKLSKRKLQLVSFILWKFSWLLRTENWLKWEIRLREWKHNCLLIYDRRDPLFTPHFYDDFAKKLTSTNVVSTVDAGHISIVQQPKLIAGVMREYLLRDFYQQAEGYN